MASAQHQQLSSQPFPLVPIVTAFDPGSCWVSDCHSFPTPIARLPVADTNPLMSRGIQDIFVGVFIPYSPP